MLGTSSLAFPMGVRWLLCMWPAASRDANICHWSWRVVLLPSSLRGVSLNYEGLLGLHLGVVASSSPEGPLLPPFPHPCLGKLFLHPCSPGLLYPRRNLPALRTFLSRVPHTYVEEQGSKPDRPASTEGEGRNLGDISGSVENFSGTQRHHCAHNIYSTEATGQWWLSTACLLLGSWVLASVCTLRGVRSLSILHLQNLSCSDARIHEIPH